MLTIVGLPMNVAALRVRISTRIVLYMQKIRCVFCKVDAVTPPLLTELTTP